MPLRPRTLQPVMAGQETMKNKQKKQLFNIANAVHRILVFVNFVLHMKCPQTFALSWREAYEI